MRWLLGAGVAAGLMAGTVMAVITPPGAPYDEPAHYDNVVFYGDRLELPEMGDPGVEYQAQQPPLYYVPAGAAHRVAVTVLSDQGAFYAVRLLTVLLLVPIALATRSLGRQLFPASPDVADAAGAVSAVAAPMVALASSVQNDSLVVVLGIATVARFARSEREQSSRLALTAGCFGALAVLAKTSALPVVAGCLVACMIGHRGRWLPRLLALAVPVVLGSGWWFARNLAVYGDFTGHAAVQLAGYPEFEVTPPTIGSAAALAWSTVAYYWAPAEYYRNVFTVPWSLRLGTAAALFAAVIGLARDARRRLLGVDAVALLVTGSAVAATFAIFLAVHLTTDPIPPRLTYVAFGAFAVALCAGTRAIHPLGPPGLVAFAVLVDVCFLFYLAQEPSRVFHLW